VIGYRCEVCVIEIYDFDNEVAAKIECFDSEASCVTVTDKNVHTVESWRELSSQIEAALLQIHPAK
jgi:hypothetical protein